MSQLWVQDKVGDGSIDLRKVKGTENLADTLTKHVNQDNIKLHMIGTGQEFRGEGIL